MLYGEVTSYMAQNFLPSQAPFTLESLVTLAQWSAERVASRKNTKSVKGPAKAGEPERKRETTRRDAEQV